MSNKSSCDNDYWLSKSDVVTFLTTKPSDVIVAPSNKVCLYCVMLDPEGGVMMPVTQFYSGLGPRWQAEHQALFKVKEQIWNIKMEVPSGRVIFIMNYSPGQKCADEIIEFCDKFPKIEFKILFSGVEDESLEALEKMMFHGFRRIELSNIRGLMWPRLLNWRKEDSNTWWEYSFDRVHNDEPEIAKVVESSTNVKHGAIQSVLLSRNLQDTMVEEVMGEGLKFPIPITGDRFLAIRKEADEKAYEICTGKHFLK